MLKFGVGTIHANGLVQIGEREVTKKMRHDE